MYLRQHMFVDGVPHSASTRLLLFIMHTTAWTASQPAENTGLYRMRLPAYVHTVQSHAENAEKHESENSAK